jgi:hypothetical protein
VDDLEEPDVEIPVKDINSSWVVSGCSKDGTPSTDTKTDDIDDYGTNDVISNPNGPSRLFVTSQNFEPVCPRCP